MSALKDLLIEVQEELAENYMYQYPGSTWQEAYDATTRTALSETQSKIYQMYGGADYS